MQPSFFRHSLIFVAPPFFFSQIGLKKPLKSASVVRMESPLFVGKRRVHRKKHDPFSLRREESDGRRIKNSTKKPKRGKNNKKVAKKKKRREKQ